VVDVDRSPASDGLAAFVTWPLLAMPLVRRTVALPLLNNASGHAGFRRDLRGHAENIYEKREDRDDRGVGAVLHLQSRKLYGGVCYFPQSFLHSQVY